MKRIQLEIYGWLMEVVSSRSYELDVRSYLYALKTPLKP